MKLYTFEITYTPRGEFACLFWVQHDCIENYEPESGYELASSPAAVLYIGRTPKGPQVDLTRTAGTPEEDAIHEATAVRLISPTLERPSAVLDERIRDYVAKNPDGQVDPDTYMQEVQEMLAEKEREAAEEPKGSSSPQE